jgi:hypothetical protein
LILDCFPDQEGSTAGRDPNFRQSYFEIILGRSALFLRLYAKIQAEAIAIAGPDNADPHIVGFDEYGSIRVHCRFNAEQRADKEGGSSVDGAGLVDFVKLANNLAHRAGHVVACTLPPKLFSEILMNDNNRIEIKQVCVWGGTEAKAHQTFHT